MTNTKTVTKNVNTWALKSRTTGKVYPSFSYPTRTAARKAAKGRRFKGDYFPVKMDTSLTVRTKPSTTSKKRPTVDTSSAKWSGRSITTVRKDPTNFSNFVSKMGFHPFWIWPSDDVIKGK